MNYVGNMWLGCRLANSMHKRVSKKNYFDKCIVTIALLTLELHEFSLDKALGDATNTKSFVLFKVQPDKSFVLFEVDSQ